MKITIAPSTPRDAHQYPTVTIETPCDALTIEEFAELCQQAALAFGYHPDNVNDHFITE